MFNFNLFSGPNPSLTQCFDETCSIIRGKWFEQLGVRLPTYSRVTADHVTRHNFSSKGAILPEKYSCFVGELEDPKMKQNIAFQAVKPFIPPGKHQLYAENLMQDVAIACDSEEGESKPPEEGQEEQEEAMPMSFAACHEILIRQPKTPIYAYIFPIDCSKMFERTGVIHIGDKIYDQKAVCLVYAYPTGGFQTMHPYGELYQKGEYKGSYEVMCRKAEIEQCQRIQKLDPQLVTPYEKAEESYLRSVEKAI